MHATPRFYETVFVFSKYMITILRQHSATGWRFHFLYFFIYTLKNLATITSRIYRPIGYLILPVFRAYLRLRFCFHFLLVTSAAISNWTGCFAKAVQTQTGITVTTICNTIIKFRRIVSLNDFGIAIFLGLFCPYLSILVYYKQPSRANTYRTTIPKLKQWRFRLTQTRP